MKRLVMMTALTAALVTGIADGQATGASAEARLADSTAKAGALANHPRIDRCADRHPWLRVAHRARLVWCIAHTFNSPGAPRTAVAVGHCESGSDLQDLDGSDGHISTFQHITSKWYGRWWTWGRRIGVKSAPTNVLSQAVVSVRMAISLGTWNSSAGWSASAWCWG